MNELLGLIRSIGIARLAAIMGVTMGVAVALALIIARIGEPPLSILYAGLDPSDAQAVTDRLEQESLKHEIRDSGGKIAVLAPRSEIARLRMELAADGVVSAGGVGYEIFDKDEAFGATSFQQNINRLRALEGELARTISTISGVRSARVHLVLAERELFSRDKKAASASIVVDAPGGLDQRSVRAIINLTASAVPELAPSRVTLLDAAGELLASGQSEDAAGAGVNERTAAVEARLRRTVEDIVGRIVGVENLRVQVAADLDFNRVTENSETIDPDSQTVLSSVTVEESSDSSDTALGRGVTVANALPGAQVATEGEPGSKAANRRTEETTNYEISRTVRSEVRELGTIKRLSVAVALDAGANGERARTPENLARIDALVKSAVGFDEARGDKIDVVEIAFTPAQAVETSAAATDAPFISRDIAMRAVEVGALALIALALAAFVLAPMLAPSKLRPMTAAGAEPSAASRAELSSPLALPKLNTAFEQKIDLARVEGQVKASSLNKVAEVVKGHTDESAGILKGWIRQAS
ncbi:MAG: flagellar basal-body MS-ring/collar protein FliF [Parvularculaceae bacterium]